MYHEVNGTHGCDAEMVLEMTRGEPVKWEEQSDDDLTITIMKLALTNEHVYTSLHYALTTYAQPERLSALEQRILQIFLNLAKGNTHATEPV